MSAFIPRAGVEAIWHPAGNVAPQPVLVLEVLRQRVRVVDLCAAAVHDVTPGALTFQPRPWLDVGTRVRDRLAAGPGDPRNRVAPPAHGQRCPRCHSRRPPARCALCAPAGGGR